MIVDDSMTLCLYYHEQDIVCTQSKNKLCFVGLSLDFIFAETVLIYNVNPGESENT